MAGDGRFSVPLGRLLLAIHREEDAISVQHRAAECFFQERRYHLPIEEGLYKPILLVWEIEVRRAREDLLRSVVTIQALLSKRNYEMEPLLKFISDRNSALFNTLQDVLREGLRKLSQT